MKMNPQIKQDWIEALKSGRYKQGKNGLRNGNNYCVLGVLCDLYDQAHNQNNWQLAEPSSNPCMYEQDDYCHMNESGVLPYEVSQWAKLDYTDPITRISFSNRSGTLETKSLVYSNDDGIPFEQLAKLIDSQL